MDEYDETVRSVFLRKNLWIFLSKKRKKSETIVVKIKIKIPFIFHPLFSIFNGSIDKNAQHKPLNLISITRSSNNNISIFVRST